MEVSSKLRKDSEHPDTGAVAATVFRQGVYRIFRFRRRILH